MHDVTRAVLFSPATLTARLARGTAKGTVGLWRWITDADHGPHYKAAIEKNPTEVEKHRNAWAVRKQRKAGALLLTAAVLFVLGWWGHVTVGAWTWQAALVAVMLAAIAVGGKPRPQAEVLPAVPVKEKTDQTRLTPDATVSAFTAALPSVAKAIQADPKSFALLGPVHRDGPGWAATVELPPAVTIEDCVRNRERLASGLRVAAEQLQLSAGRHAGQCRMWVSDVHPSEMPDVDWAYASRTSVSLVDPLPVGVTFRGSPVTLSLRTNSPDGQTIAGGSMLVGGVSGSGKTTFMRLIVSAAAMDPDATIAIFDGKGDNDYSAFEPVCDWLRVGASPDNLNDLYSMLVEVQEEMVRRQKNISPRAPLLVVIDELQRVKDKDTQDVIEDILRIGRSSGIFMLLATQRPSAETVPTDLRDSTRTRVCLKVHGQAANDMVLGTGAYKDGRDATKFTQGTALMLDVDTDAVDVVRVANVTTEIAARIAKAHSRRPGPMFSEPRALDEMAGEDEDTVEIPAVEERPLTVVDRVMEVWPEGEDRASCAELAESLSALGGEFWGWQAADVTRALKPYGVESRALDFETEDGSRRLRGVRRLDLERALQLA